MTDGARNRRRAQRAALLRSAGLGVVLIYAAGAGLWVLGSDWLLARWVDDRELLLQLNAFKGWFFVAVTSVVLYLLIRRLSTLADPICAPGPALQSATPATVAIGRGLRWRLPLAVFGCSVFLGTIAATLALRFGWIDLSLHQAIWFVAAIGQIVLALAATAVLWQQRQALHLLRAEQSDQVDKLQTLDLLHAITGTSTDSIYAKDASGRYLLFNAAGCRYWGLDADDVVGKEDQALFGAEIAASFRAGDLKVMQSGEVETIEEDLQMAVGRVIFLTTKGPLFDSAGGVVGVYGISHDITARKRAEVAARESAELIQAVEDSVLDHLAVLDREGRIVAVNAAWRRFADQNSATPGQTPRHTGVGANYLEICAAATRQAGSGSDDARRANDGIQAVITGREARFSLVYPCPSPTQARWFQMTVSPLRSGDGGAVIVHTDITALEQSEIALRESESANRALLHALVDGVFVAVDDRFVFANPALVAMLGYTDAEFADQRFEHIVAPEFLADWVSHCRRCQEADGAAPTQFQARLRCKNGHAGLWVELRARPFRHRGQAGVLGIVRDISDRRRAEQDLQLSEARFRAAFEHAQVGISETAIDGRLLRVNARMTEITGYSRDELQRMSFQDISHPDDLAGDLTLVDEVMAGRRASFKLEKRYVHRDGHPVWIEMTTALVRDAEGEPQYFVAVSEDISVRRQAQAALRESEERYRSMIGALSEGVLIFDQQARISGCNPSAERILGWSFDQMQSRRQTEGFDRALRPDGQPFPLDELPMSKTLTSGQTCREVDMGFQREDGRIAWLRVNSVPLRDPTGDKIVGAVLSFSDISDRHAADQRLQELSMAVEQSPSGILITDANSMIEYVNTAFSRITGYAAVEVIGRNPRFMQSGKTPRAQYEKMWKTLTRGEVWQGQFCNLHKNGQEFIQSALLSPLKAADGRVIRYVGIIDDITGQIRASAELAQYRDRLEELVAERTLALAQANTALSGSEQFTRTIADNLPDMVAYFDTELRCRFANRAALEWFGKSAAEMAGIAMFDLVGAAVYAEKLPLYKAVLAGEAQHFERAMIRLGDGRPVNAWFHFIPEVHDRRVNGFVAIANDISAIKQAELGLQKANLDLIVARDRAEAASRAKSAFLANMSHEIRTPMNAIIGLAHLIRRDSDDDLQDKRLGKMTVAAHHLLEVIDDILDLSNIESGKIDIKRADFDVEDLLVRASALVADRARAKGLELVIDFANLPTRLAGDSTRLQQALLNLLSNAVKFTEAGSIVLSGELIARAQAPLLIRFEVHDTGIGIATDSMMHIFDAFEQADTSTTRRFGGTGLGLAITRHLAQLMGGEVGADSVPGAGSRFWFSAEVHPAATAAPLPADSGWPELGQVASPMRRRILVIDDLAAARDSVATMLTKLGFEVATASAIEPGLHLIEAPGAAPLQGQGADPASARPFALVLVDRDLGGEDGLEFPLHVKGDAAPQFVLMSADDSASARALALRAGFRAVVSKPVAPGALVAMFGTLKASMGVATGALAANDPVAELQRRSASLLLAEDNPINQEVALELLRSAGMAVDLAENGVEAVALATEKAYDLILMDVQMPEMDGLAATRLIRQLAGHQRTPIIALTASVFGEDVDAGIAAGMNEYLAKPVDPARLYACLLKWLKSDFATTVAAVDIASAAPAAPPRVKAAVVPVAAAETGAALPAIGGLDLALALGFSGGRVEPCMRVLRQFAQIHRAGLRDLDAHLASGDRGAAMHLVHSLRGAGGAVGATRLVELAAALEVSLAQPLPLSRLARESALLQVELRHLVANIEEALPGAETRPLELDDMEIANSELDDFEKLIASADFSAAAMYRSLAPRLRERYGEPARQLGDALRNFDHERALALLRLLRRR